MTENQDINRELFQIARDASAKHAELRESLDWQREAQQRYQEQLDYMRSLAEDQAAASIKMEHERYKG